MIKLIMIPCRMFLFVAAFCAAVSTAVAASTLTLKPFPSIVKVPEFPRNHTATRRRRFRADEQRWN